MSSPLKKLDNFTIFRSLQAKISVIKSEIMAKNIIYQRTLWHFNSMFGSSLSARSAYQRFSLHSASISRILEPSTQGLISSGSPFQCYIKQKFKGVSKKHLAPLCEVYPVAPPFNKAKCTDTRLHTWKGRRKKNRLEWEYCQKCLQMQQCFFLAFCKRSNDR